MRRLRAQDLLRHYRGHSLLRVADAGEPPLSSAVPSPAADAQTVLVAEVADRAAETAADSKVRLCTFVFRGRG